MSNIATQIRIDQNVKQEAAELFAMLGIDMSSAVNMFLRQCIIHGGLPFDVKIPQYKKEVLEAMREAKEISEKQETKRYSSFKEALNDIDL